MPYIILILFGVLGLAKSSLSATINAASCSQSDVQSAINSASNGDTVTIPAGNCTWTSGINTSKSISIKGSGSGSLTIALSGTGIYLFDLTGCTNANKCAISGMTIDAANLSINSSSIISINGPNAEVAFRMTDIKMINLCGGGGSG